MDNTEFVNLVATAIDKLAAQGKPSRTYTKCLYKGPDNMCCIVGHMMPDDDTRQLADSMPDGTGIRSLVDQDFVWISDFSWEQLDLLTVLQEHHDTSEVDSFDITIRAMRKHLRNFNMEGSW